jgi:hypothetical protein
MRNVIVLWLMLMVGLVVSSSKADPPPANDTCAGAIAIEPCTNGTFSGDLQWAINDYDPGVPGPSCTGFDAPGGDVVFKVDLRASDTINLTYTPTDYDASFYIVTDCADISGTCVAGADAGVSGSPETINYTATSTGTYYIVTDRTGSGGYGSHSEFSLDYHWICYWGACCFGTRCEFYFEQGELGCYIDGGVWQGDGTDCDPNPCDETPIQPTTWGRIRTMFR